MRGPFHDWFSESLTSLPESEKVSCWDCNANWTLGNS